MCPVWNLGFLPEPLAQGAKMSGQIFISYRREDASSATGRLYDRLSAHFPHNQIFMDVDSHIPPGVDFVGVIEKNAGSCDVLIAVIGRFWLTACEEKKQRRWFEKEKRRLDNPRDYVRLEIATALKRGIWVIPALVDGASMPQSEELPQDLKPLVRRQALTISHDRFRADADSLVAAVELALEKTTAEQREREEEERLERERQSPLERATKEHPWINSLGMKFVPVAGTQVLFSIWDTRVQDFEAFVADTNYDATEGMWSLGKDGWKKRGAIWREPGFSQGPNHPVVGVSWNDAKKFCQWLTGREQGSGVLPRGRVYRLPTDAEWSAGVGLQGEEGTNPEEKHLKINLFPWGKKWPPPKGAGNYAGEEAKTRDWSAEWVVIEGYNDGYPRTSPVGSFAANVNGLYDMGGNVWQWCEDWYDAWEKYRVVRGGSCYDGIPAPLLASSRYNYAPDYRGGNIGIRCVVGAESSR
jgi:formylglycine-generating enzyme required for sulfatase activity